MQRQTRQTKEYTPQDIIASLNRSVDALNINGTPDTHHIARRNKNNCLKWLREHFVKFYQTQQGYYRLGEMPTKQNHGGNQNESSSTTGTTDRDNDRTINEET